jgi:hypothetical protein
MKHSMHLSSGPLFLKQCRNGDLSGAVDGYVLLPISQSCRSFVAWWPGAKPVHDGLRSGPRRSRRCPRNCSGEPHPFVSLERQLREGRMQVTTREPGDLPRPK